MTQTLRLVCLALLMAAPIFAQSATPQYSVSELPGTASRNDTQRFATAINDAGQVVGTARIFGDDTAILWDHGTPIAIGVFGVAGPDGSAVDINERGQIVWNNSGTGPFHAFLWEGGVNTPLDSLGGRSGAFAGNNLAFAINDAGQIVGCSALLPTSFDGCETAVMWSGGEVIRLGASGLQTWAINNRGQIIASTPTAPVLLWDNGVLSELPGLSGALDINDRGEILGLSDGRPVIWAHGIITPLALPPGEWGVYPSSINDLGHAVGTIISTAPGALAMAVLWRDGEVIPLPPLVANESMSAADINNRGEIVGWTQGSGSRRALLWVPQAPTTPTTTPGDVGPAPATPEVLPTDLGTLGGKYSTPTGINDNGVVVGSSTTGAKEQHAFVWMPSNGMVDLGTFGDRSAPGVDLRTSFATAVSNDGEVVGASYVPGPTLLDGYRAFLWTPSAGMQIIGTPTVFFSDATAINDAGQVVGNNGGSEVWTATGGWVDIGTFGGAVQPVANNNLGQVVGTSALGTPSFAFARHAFVWTSSGGMVDLGTLGGPSSAAAAVNQSGHVVGWAQTAGTSLANNWRAFLWTAASGMLNLGSLGGPYSVARDVNELDMVVGASAVASGNPAVHAFVWTSAAGMRDLGTLGGTESEAYAVSDTGLVVGRSLTTGDAASHGFAWTPNNGMVDLVPLAGYTDSVAYLVNSSGAVVGSSYDRVSGTYRATMWDVPAAPPIDEFTFCATEGDVCVFKGKVEVRYGANGSFVFKTLNNSTACTNKVFGDPAPDTPKECAIRTPPTPPPTEWTFCAPEGGVCAFTGKMEVRYGANGSFVVKTLNNGTACTNKVFGDPAPDVAKSCSLPQTGP